LTHRKEGRNNKTGHGCSSLRHRLTSAFARNASTTDFTKNWLTFQRVPGVCVFTASDCNIARDKNIRQCLSRATLSVYLTRCIDPV